ncbi:c-type cytochrome [Methylobacterium planeticum]|uniref:C-type cytochrome n=1 Tax=Methylobacterium planeticum TaxID=2615211 RepID=A0A6N6MQQ4_9HYPH|nr:c-type cytochrome [Methylobacterium planeticum]KAB1070832.1 c-type cytochrome [Methylobacterium planeticum]
MPPIRLRPRAGSFLSCLVLLSCLAVPAGAEMRGHGGPVRALAVTADGTRAISGSFDQSAILWSVEAGTADQVLRFHEGAVNAVAILPGGRFATGGEDGRIAVWQPGAAAPIRVFAEHAGPVVGLAVSPDGLALASASWDGTARLRPLAGGEVVAFEGHKGNVNAVAFLSDGRLVSAGYDATLRIWARPGEGDPPRIVTLPSPLNTVAVAPDGEIVAAGADATLRILRPDTTLRAELELAPNPIIAVALSPDGARIAAATIGGAVAIVERASARPVFNLVGPGLPVWSLAFRSEAELVTGGGDRLIRRWDMRNGAPIGSLAMARPHDELARFAGEPGAEVFRACAACHSLTPEGGNRAGPTLSGVFGRRIATAEGYRFSEALKKLDIVWNADTIARLFEVGPSRYTPGTKMPEQTVNSAADRAALVRFLEKATRTP